MDLPPFQLFPQLSDTKLMLRQILPADIKDILEISYYDGIQAETVEQAAEMQDKINQDYVAGNSIHWGIAEVATNKIIGSCGYYRGFEQAAGELGCVLLPQYRGQGYMTNAMRLAIDFGQNTIGLKRIWAATSKQNIKAIKLLERNNFGKTNDLESDEVEYKFIG